MSEKSISEVITNSMREEATKVINGFLDKSGVEGETKQVIVEKLVNQSLESFGPIAKEILGASLDVTVGPFLSRQVQFLLELFFNILDKKGGDFFRSCLESFEGGTISDAQENKLLNQFRIAADSLKQDISYFKEKVQDAIPEAIKEVTNFISS
jgi:hypothetical protein